MITILSRKKYRKILPLLPPSGSLQLTSISLEGIYAHIWSLNFCSCHLRKKLLDCLVLIANWACILESHKTVGNKEECNYWTEEIALPHAYSLGPEQMEQTKKFISVFH